MSEPNPDREDHASDETDRSASNGSGTPRWVIVFGIILIAMVLIFIILQLADIGGGHGPGRHAWVGPLLLSISNIQVKSQ